MSERWFDAALCSLDDFRTIVEQPVDLADYPNAIRVEQGVVAYRAVDLRDHSDRPALLAEIASVLDCGPGIVVFEGAFDPAVLDSATIEFEAMIDAERATKGDAGDHFAPAGANDRVWNALEKLALRNADVFVDYYANDVIALASLAWLGPNYQVTSQVNVVNPGGQAQQPHRDYHLGFMEDHEAARFPPHTHRLSPLLTLQVLWHTATCRSTRARRCICRTRRSMGPATSRGVEMTSSTTSRSSTHNFRCRKAMRCSSILPCSTARVPT